MATANEARTAVRDKYKTILGRNSYSQPRRAYCFRKYSDGKYYSDCSSSIMKSYEEAGYPISSACLNTVGMYQCAALKTVPVQIKNGVIQNPEALRVGDMLLFAGTDSSRAYADCVGHVEMVGEISGSTIYLYGHGSGTPRKTEMNAYCKSRYAAKTGTRIGSKGLLKVVRFIWDGGDGPRAVIRNCAAANIRTGPGTSFPSAGTCKPGDSFAAVDPTGWVPVLHGGAVRWVSAKYAEVKA